MKRVPGFVIPMALSALATIQTSANAASEMFIKFDGIDGESVDEIHKDAIDVLAWSWSLSNTSTDPTRGSTPVVRPIVFTKYLDKASAPIYSSLLKGEMFPKVELFVRETGAKEDYLIIEMSDVIITSASQGGEAAQLERFSENVSLYFRKICQTYRLIDESGGIKEEQTACWDTVLNK